MTQSLEFSVSQLRSAQQPPQDGSISSKRIQYQGYEHLSKVSKKPNFKALMCGQTTVVAKGSVVQILDEEDDVLTFFAQSKAKIKGPALFRVVKQKGEAIGFFDLLKFYFKRFELRNMIIFPVLCLVASAIGAITENWWPFFIFGVLPPVFILLFVFFCTLVSYSSPDSETYHVRPKRLPVFDQFSPENVADGDKLDDLLPK